MSSNEKENESSDRAGTIAVVVAPLLVLGVVAAVVVGPRFYGATPMQIMDEPLSRTPKQLGHDLPRTSVYTTSVTVSFRKGTAGEYESVEFDWATGGSDAPNAMRLRAEHHAEGRDEVTSVLKRRLRTFRDGKYRWGAVTIRVRDGGDVSFEVDRKVDGKPNPLFDRQIEAAKEVVLNAAFDLPIRVSDAEIADALGTGYSPAALAKFDASTPVEQAAAALRTAFPATIPSGSTSFYVPLDHPLVDKVRLSWSNRAGGKISSIGLTTSASYPGSRVALEACLAKKIGPPRTDVIDYAAGKKNYAFAVGTIGLSLGEDSISVRASSPVDAASFTALFQALDGCREAAESGGPTK